MLEAYPLRTKMVSAFVIFGSADTASQAYEQVSVQEKPVGLSAGGGGGGPIAAVYARAK
jgi:hypothetical protein